MTKVGPLGVLGPGGQADLVASGEGRAVDGNGLRQQNRELLKCRVIDVISNLTTRSYENDGHD